MATWKSKTESWARENRHKFTDEREFRRAVRRKAEQEYGMVGPVTGFLISKIIGAFVSMLVTRLFLRPEA